MRTIFCCFVLLIITSASFAGEKSEQKNTGKEKCPVCGMNVSMFADWNAKVKFTDDTFATFDGTKDMFKYYLDMKRYNPARNSAGVKAITVKDYYTKTDFDARNAFYVIWSNVYGPMGHEPIAFEKEAGADTFLQEHLGKRILRFKDITLQLLHSLDNPE